MRISARLKSQFIKALSQSMSVAQMEKLADRVIHDYNLHRQTGFPETIPIPQLDAARQITQDMLDQGFLSRFAEVLIDVDRNGVMGRSITIHPLPQIIDEIESLGLVFNEEYGIFVEGEQVKTKGWGILREGSIYELSFLRLDIVGNSELVRTFPEVQVARAYADLQALFAKIVEGREGRVWTWEGDGGLAAFYFANKNIQAALSGMEILLEMFMYNLFDCPIAKPLSIRLAVHTGPSHFYENVKQIQSDTLRRLEQLESRYTATNNLTISPGVYSDMGTKLASFFKPFEVSAGNFLHKYSLGWE